MPCVACLSEYDEDNTNLLAAMKTSRSTGNTFEQDAWKLAVVSA